jgi:hypothetical protein
MRKFVFWASIAFLLFLGLSGIQSCLSDWSLVTTPAQRACTIGQAVFGTFGLLAGIGAVIKRRWAGPAALVFAVSGGLTAGLATVAWGGAGLGTGVASGGLGLLLGTLLYLGISDPSPSSGRP